MKLSRIHPSRPAFLVLLLTAALFAACDTEECPCPPPDFITASGKVLDLGSQTGGTVAGATIQLITNTYDFQNPNYVRPCECEADLCQYRTRSNLEGLWAMEVPVEYTETWAPMNMLFKVSKGDDPPHYNLFQPGGTNPGTDVPALQGGTNQGDLQLIPPFLYEIMSGSAIAGGADPDELAVILGVAIGFVETGYPGVVEFLPGVTVTIKSADSTERFPVTYLDEGGGLDPDLTETSSQGIYFTAVPDATDDGVPMVSVSGEKPGSVFVNTFNAACPASATSVAVIDPYFQP